MRICPECYHGEHGHCTDLLCCCRGRFHRKPKGACVIPAMEPRKRRKRSKRSVQWEQETLATIPPDRMQDWVQA